MKKEDQFTLELEKKLDEFLLKHELPVPSAKPNAKALLMEKIQEEDSKVTPLWSFRSQVMRVSAMAAMFFLIIGTTFYFVNQSPRISESDIELAFFNALTVDQNDFYTESSVTDEEESLEDYLLF